MNTLTPFEVISSHIQKLKSSLYTSLPAEVVEVNVDGDIIKSVNIRPYSDKLFPSDGLVLKRSIIYNVPLVFPSGGGAILSFPVKAGDIVLAVFSQEDIDNFKKGETGLPQTQRKFSINDSFAIPSIYPLNQSLNPNKDNVEIKYNGNTIILTQEGNVEIKTKSTLKVNNESEELISLLSEVLGVLENTTVNTIYGQSPLNTKSQITELKQRLETFKEE